MTGRRRTVARLRTKSGCLTCRQRRKKCNEARPICLCCTRSDRQCIWPTEGDMIDGRHIAVRRKKAQDTSDSTEVYSIISEDDISSAVVATCLESLLSHHFVDRYYSLLISPDSHPSFHDEWIADIQISMPVSASLKYSVLANAASNVFLAGKATRMQEVALSCYSLSMRGLSKGVQAPWSYDHKHNSTLTSVIMLYLHGFAGWGTYTDVPHHTRAAMQMLRLRYNNNNDNGVISLSTPYDRIAVESVIYQLFLIKMDLWSVRTETSWSSGFDAQFWLSCESVLARSVLFPGESTACNSPVLGIPFVLYKIMMMIRQLWETDSGSTKTERYVCQLQVELHPWEILVKDIDNGQGSTTLGHFTPETTTGDSAILMALAASLLILHLSSPHRSSSPRPPAGESWQISCALNVLRRRMGDRVWADSYVGNYPVYIIGHFMRNEAEMALVRADLSLRSKQTAISQVHRYQADLESTWQRRQSDAAGCQAVGSL